MRLERLESYPLEIEPRRPYRNFFVWEANLPFKEETISEAFSMFPYPKVIDIVGCANITNLIAIADTFSLSGSTEIRVFDSARETNLLLPYYFDQVADSREIPTDRGRVWNIKPDTTLSVVGHESYIAHEAVNISLFDEWYENIFYKLNGSASFYG